MNQVLTPIAAANSTVVTGRPEKLRLGDVLVQQRLVSAANQATAKADR